MLGFEVFDALKTHCEFYQQGEPYYHNCKINSKKLDICTYGECPIMKEFLKNKEIQAASRKYILT